MLSVRNIYKMYEGKPLLQGISFDLEDGETICLLGRSGSGKSTLLRIIAGIELPDDGQILWNGQDLINVPIHKRNFGLMFQDFALFPHMSVYENVAFGLRMAEISAEAISNSVKKELKKVQMSEFSARRVTELSGGEQQRVALARALAPHPRLLMLDEPLGALDKTLKAQLLHDIRLLLLETEIPAIYVTHDQEEAFSIADRLLLLRDGIIVQSGFPKQVYQNPKDGWVANFLGLNNLFTGTVESIDPLMVNTSIGSFLVENRLDSLLHAGDLVDILIRPDAVGNQMVGMNVVEGIIKSCVFVGPGYHIELKVHSYILELDVDEEFLPGNQYKLKLDPKSISIFTKS